ncbi:metallophosphoesterase [Kaistia dalseonensis]|uniref:3',5'-cyclic AMP phosphodiesterase CpdA n=1 Tax=Kaistia dalseonensis TaxID=410840 RepID=A0ABU0H8H3_9HYPH|nr:metallophosphoesterase [Kaistia dalseonensis]MCX5495218.1 metallophosphoesterase [Kaistia dalseonensis]MDQ0437804.1 3',5'-cyclic AMP phosphodiesterase CpdA [Kaistia dalseonensis]
MFILAHLSDPHLGPLPRPRTLELVSKRFLGYVNWRRGRMHSLAGPILGGLLDDLISNKPDHIAVTGDLMNIGLPGEIVAARQWLETFGPPDVISVVPGNHDAYVPGSLKKALAAWAPYLTGDGGSPAARVTFPYVRRRGPIAVIALSSARATGPFMATGHADASNLVKLREDLASAKREGLFRVVMIHHPPMVNATTWHKRLIGAARIRAVIRDVGAELVLHGHTHVDSFAELEGPDQPVPVVGVPAASTIPGGHRPAARYNLFKISGGPGAWHCHMTERGYQGPGSKIEVIRERRIF